VRIVGAIVAILLAAIPAIGCSDIPREKLPTDEKLITLFEEHRQDLEKLLPLESRICAGEDSLQHNLEFRRLEDIFGMGGGQDCTFGSIIYLRIDVDWPREQEDDVKGFVWSPQPLSPVAVNLDQLRLSRDRPTVVHRPLRDGWYLYRRVGFHDDTM
jgi:hypothetical protein